MLGLSKNLQPPPCHPKKKRELLIDKLAYLVEYGRTAGLEEAVLDQLYSDTLARIGVSTIETNEPLQKAAVRLTNMGLYKDAMVFFRKISS